MSATIIRAKLACMAREVRKENTQESNVVACCIDLAVEELEKWIRSQTPSLVGNNDVVAQDVADAKVLKHVIIYKLKPIDWTVDMRHYFKKGNSDLFVMDLKAMVKDMYGINITTAQALGYWSYMQKTVIQEDMA